MNDPDIHESLSTTSKAMNNVDWTVEHEQILIEWADKSMCYRWLHSRTHIMYANLNAWYTIPVIVMSTLTGTANFAQERVPIAYRAFFSMIVGGINLLAGIITTIQQFLKITQLNEAHRVSSIAWDKFYRNIKIELAKHPEERLNVIQMIKISKEEFDRLMETSPSIPDNIIFDFKDKFRETEFYQEIYKPEICDILVATHKNRNPWFDDEHQTKKLHDHMKNLQLREIKNKKNDEMNVFMVNNFKKSFFNINNREPLENEIIDNLKDTMDAQTIKEILIKLREKEINNSSNSSNNDNESVNNNQTENFTTLSNLTPSNLNLRGISKRSTHLFTDIV
jgi:hypothetical protein